jgi:hypothetical protein
MVIDAAVVSFAMDSTCSSSSSDVSGDEAISLMMKSIETANARTFTDLEVDAINGLVALRHGNFSEHSNFTCPRQVLTMSPRPEPELMASMTPTRENTVVITSSPQESARQTIQRYRNYPEARFFQFAPRSEQPHRTEYLVPSPQSEARELNSNEPKMDLEIEEAKHIPTDSIKKVKGKKRAKARTKAGGPVQPAKPVEKPASTSAAQGDSPEAGRAPKRRKIKFEDRVHCPAARKMPRRAAKNAHSTVLVKSEGPPTSSEALQGNGHQVRPHEQREVDG